MDDNIDDITNIFIFNALPHPAKANGLSNSDGIHNSAQTLMISIWRHYHRRSRKATI